MIRNIYIKYDLNNFVRSWIPSNIEICKESIYIVLIYTIDDLINFDKYPKSTVFVEIRGFSVYSDMVDYLRFGITDSFNTMFEDVIKGIGTTIDIIRSTKQNNTICLIAQHLVTIFIPEILDRFNESINDIWTIDPVFFPWTYHRVFELIRSNNTYHTIHILSLMHRRTIFTTFYKILDQPKSKGVLSNKLLVIFRSNNLLEQSVIDLQMSLSVYSNVRIRITKQSTITDIINNMP